MANPFFPSSVTALQEIFAADTSRGRDPNGAWEQAWRKDVTPWDYFDVQPALRELVEKRWNEVPNVPWASLVGGKALVPGCGRGYDVPFLASKGLDTTGADLSETAIASAKKFHSASTTPNVEFKVLDFFAFEPPSKFSLAFDYTFFCAIPPEFRKLWGTRYAELIKPGGVLIALMWPLNVDKIGGPPFVLTPEIYDEALGANFTRIYFKEAIDLKDQEAHRGHEMMSVWLRT